MTHPSTEAAASADFSAIRYAQCWEDADVLLAALDVQPGDTCLSIASAGDNSFSLLTRDPRKVVALDLNPAQLACVWLRKAAYAALNHQEFLQLLGARDAANRDALYAKCRDLLPNEAREFWDAHPALIAAGIGSAGKFERYFAFFRRNVLSRVHTAERVRQLLQPSSREQRKAFYEKRWDTWRWRMMFRMFFSRAVMGRLGRDPAFFKYVQGSVAVRIRSRARHALVELEPAENPYLQWILTGRFTTALPHALREEHFETIRSRLDRLEIHHGSIESYCATHPAEHFDRFNLSDIFEYMSEANYGAVLTQLLDRAAPRARLVYWNMLVPRIGWMVAGDRVRELKPLADDLLLKDKAFFYSRLVVEEVQ